MIILFLSLISACSNTVVETAETGDSVTEWTVQSSSDGEWIAIAAGFQHTCAINHINEITCWGRAGDSYDNDPLQPPGGAWEFVGSNQAYSCALREDGFADCWGDNDFGKARPPIDNFSDIGLGYSHACGVLTEDQSITCWGWAVQDYPAPDGAYLAVEGGYHFSVALSTDGTLYGWGYDYDGQASPPDGTYIQIAAGGEHACAVTTESQVVCWGGNDYSQASSPNAEMSQITAGANHTCGIDPTGKIHCWGDNSYGQSTPPSGSFASVSAGGAYTCAIDNSGYIHCWGWDSFGEASPP